MKRSVSFCCLGVMGYPMAGHLAAAGHGVRVYNRTRSRADAWLAEYQPDSQAEPRCGLAGTPAEAARDAEAVFVCTGNDDDLRTVVLGPEGVLSSMQPGATLVDHTTASPSIALEIDARAREAGVGFLDAPVSGGQAGAESGGLTIMLGGEPADYEAVEALLDCYARKRLLMGPAGSGQLTKAVNQICIAGVLQGLSEGLRFAECAGLDAARVVEVVSQGAAQSWQMDNRAATMLEGEFDFGFAVDWMRKDLAIAMSEAQKTGARLPLTELVDGFYERLQQQGGGRLDTSSLIELLR
ncbi:MAG: NAD(P)-dependent oxidoreductase [Myxococcota bacterium]|nr:NAD(P)-dependent oxidoreductase [Myxococcota bacterium]